MFVWTDSEEVLVNTEHIIRMSISHPAFEQTKFLVIAELPGRQTVMHRASTLDQAKEYLSRFQNVLNHNLTF